MRSLRAICDFVFALLKSIVGDFSLKLVDFRGELVLHLDEDGLRLVFFLEGEFSLAGGLFGRN